MPEGPSVTLSLPFMLTPPSAVQDAIAELASTGSIEERGAVFTQGAVVEGILDLCRYNADRDLSALRLLEPSCGDGEFLFAAVRRLLASARKRGLSTSSWVPRLSGAIFAVELHEATLARTRQRLVELLAAEGLDDKGAIALATSWLRQGDFLLTPIAGTFDVVVGNPPYVRQERIPNTLLSEYKRLFSTLYDRADLYVLFYERCLNLLGPTGVLGFICANRWIKNKYGGPLREMVARSFNLDVYIDLEQADAFHEQVDAYPAITVIRRRPADQSTGQTAVVTASRNGVLTLDSVFAQLASVKSSQNVTVVEQVAFGRDPWLVDSPEILQVVRDLEARLPTLEESGARVGIGVASGCDQVYIGELDRLPVEDARKLPLVMSGDLGATDINWSGRGIVNPWTEAGSLAPLDAFPRFAAYMQQHEAVLKARHTARQNPKAWYKTIDRIYPGLTQTPKLLIPDIKGEATVIYDAGRYYPHHNLYVVTSESWDLQVLQALLRSSVALAFVAAYCVRMAGGFLRFQAQYLRRIRLPLPDSMTDEQRDRLRAVATSTNQVELDEAALAVYALPTEAASALCAFAANARVSKDKS